MRWQEWLNSSTGDEFDRKMRGPGQNVVIFGWTIVVVKGVL